MLKMFFSYADHEHLIQDYELLDLWSLNKLRSTFFCQQLIKYNKIVTQNRRFWFTENSFSL